MRIPKRLPPVTEGSREGGREGGGDFAVHSHMLSSTASLSGPTETSGRARVRRGAMKLPESSGPSSSGPLVAIIHDGVCGRLPMLDDAPTGELPRDCGLPAFRH